MGSERFFHYAFALLFMWRRQTTVSAAERCDTATPLPRSFVQKWLAASARSPQQNETRTTIAKALIFGV
jgi:hypothetical protein